MITSRKITGILFILILDSATVVLEVRNHVPAAAYAIAAVGIFCIAVIVVSKPLTRK